MILDYHSQALSAEALDTIGRVQSFAQTARKAFRIFKSVNHIANLIRIANSGLQGTTDAVHMLLKCVDFLEQTFWVIHSSYVIYRIPITWFSCQALFFYYDNKIFFTSVKVLSCNVPKIQPFFFKAWFGADLCFLTGTILRLHLFWKHKAEVVQKLSEIRSQSNILGDSPAQAENLNNSDHLKEAIVSSTYSPLATQVDGVEIVTPSLQSQLETELSHMSDVELDQYWYLTKVTCICKLNPHMLTTMLSL